MAFNNKELNKKITTFLNKSSYQGALTQLEKGDLVALFGERDPPAPPSPIWDDLARQKGRLFAWLGMTRKTTEAGDAAKIDNLLVIINSFVAIFCVAALLPVLYIYRGRTWIIPVVLFCPFMHFLACRFAKNPAVRRSTVNAMHLFAAVVSVVPLAFLAGFLARYVGALERESIYWGAIGGVWTLYLIAVFLLIRTESAFFWALRIFALCGNAALWFGFRERAAAIGLDLILAAILLVLAERSAAGKNALPAWRVHRAAGFCIGVAFLLNLFLLYDWTPPSRLGLSIYLASLIFLPFSLRAEAVRLDKFAAKYYGLALLAITWLYFPVSQILLGAFHAGDFPVGHGARIYEYYFMALELVLIIAWSVWVLHEQYMGEAAYDEDMFGFFAATLVLCLLVMYVGLSLRLGAVVSLGLAIAVCLVTARLRKRHRERVKTLEAPEADIAVEE